MAIIAGDYITYISLGLALASVILTLIVITRLKNPNYKGNHMTPTNQSDLVEVSAIVSEFSLRLKKLEESLVDQKVKLEIISLRMDRGIPKPAAETSIITEPRLSRYGKVSQGFEEDRSTLEKRILTPPPLSALVERKSPNTNYSSSGKRPGITELEALRMVLEGKGVVTAREIQQKVGRTREHTARMMNSLYHGGLVDRDVTAKPFAYSITQKGKDQLNS